LRDLICFQVRIIQQHHKGASRLQSRVVFLMARLIPSILSAVTAAVLTRILQPVEYGLYALGLSIIFFLTIGTFEWLGLSILRMARTVECSDLFFGTVMTCFLALFGVSAVGAAVVLVVGGLEDYTMLTAASFTAAFLSAWVELKQRLQLAELREKAFFQTSVGRGAVAVICVCTTAYVYRSAPAILLSLAVSSLIVGVFAREPRLTFFRNRFDLTVCRTLLRFGVPLSVSIGMATILMSVDKWMLQGLSGPHDLGLFTAATLVAQVPILALAGGIGPWAYSMAVEALEFRSEVAARIQLERNFTLLFAVVLPAATGISALSLNLAHLLVGDLYWDMAVRLTPWLSATAVLLSIRAYYIDIAFQLGQRTSPLIWTSLVAVIVNVAMDYWLIPTAGPLGAAIGSFCALVVSSIVATIASRRVFRLPFPFGDSVKIAVVTGMMFLVLRELSAFRGAVALGCQIAIGVIVYAVGIMAFNVLGVRYQLIQSMRHFRQRFAPEG
jgi:O-antigen/teichoic acid export membrane protein